MINGGVLAGALAMATVPMGATSSESATSATAPSWVSATVATSPPVRHYAAMAYDPFIHQMVLFGGQVGTGYLNDTWIWNGSSWTSVSSSNVPTPRANAAMAYDPVTHQLVLFGGQNNGTKFNDTWTFNGTSWSQVTTTNPPSARYGAKMVYDSATSQVLLFGGSPGSLNDTWEWDGSNWVQLSPVTSPPIVDFDMVYDPATRNVVLFGVSNATTLSDTWIWDGTNWSEAAPPASPPARYRATMAYDPAVGGVALFGGYSLTSQLLADTWIWDGTTWSQIFPSVVAPPRVDAVMEYDPVNSNAVLFGGLDPFQGALADTWILGSAPSAPTNVTTTPVSITARKIWWTASPMTGGLPITGYTATAQDATSAGRGGQSCTTVATACVITGLAIGDSYSFSVTATNSVGASSPSTPSASVTPAMVPDAPTGAVASAHANGESVVNWRAPTSDGGSVITGYTATATDLTAPRRGGQSCATIATTRCVIAGLTNGDRYRVSVTATNVVGTSSPSVMSAVVIPAAVPGSPSRVVVSAVARGVVRVQWRAPSATNGARVSGYVVRAWPGGRTWHVGGSTTLRVASLNPHVTYVFTVAARNAAGTGTASTPSPGIAG